MNAIVALTVPGACFWAKSSRRLNLVIRLQQGRLGRLSYHTNLLAGLGRASSG
jgi:hypothetical protein